MAIIKVGQRKVDVASRHCSPDLKCFQLGFDQGVFVQGRGYTRYHKKARPVCWTRHLHGCPHAGVCLDCRTIISPAAALAGVCSWCGSQNIELDEPETES